MISNKDRSGYFGASDTKYIVGNWHTKTFEKWWLQKIGITHNDFQNKYTLAGTNYEHKIIDFLNIYGMKKDTQVVLEDLKLRVNLDGNTDSKIYEIKTYNYAKGFDLNKHKDYVMQVQVQMYATGIKRAEIDAYGLQDSDYENYFNPIDENRLSKYEIEYDNNFIENEYLPKLKYLAECLVKGTMPS